MSDLRKLMESLGDIAETEKVSLLDSIDLELSEHFVIETGVVGFTDDGIVLEADEQTLGLLEVHDILLESDELEEAKPGLWANIHAKRKRIKSGSGERMRKPGSKGAPSAQDFKDAAKTSKNESAEGRELYGLKDGDDVRIIDGKFEGKEGHVIDMNPDTMEVELLLHGPDAGRTITVDVRDTEAVPKLREEENKEPLFVAISKENRERFEDEMESEGVSIPEPKIEGNYFVYDYTNASPLDQGYADEWNEATDAEDYEDDDEYDDSMDGDEASALASAGWGTDEDYGSAEDTFEAEYQGRKVPLGKPMAGDVKKSKVYVRKPNGKVVKVNFGDKNMKIKKSNPKRRKSFRARHNCANPGPRWKARYWSCRAW